MSYDTKVKGNDIRTQTLPKERAKQLIQGCNARGTSVLVIRLLTELGKDTLSELLNFNGELHLPDVQIIEPISTHKQSPINLKFIYLDAVENLDPIKHSFHLSLQTGISLSGLKTITPEIAQVIKSRSFPTHLNGVTFVSEVVGEILENTPGMLRFDSLEQENCPPLLQSRFLSRELKEYCDLISELSLDFARSLKENIDSDNLSLNNLKKVSPETAKEITGKHSLELNAISELTHELAEVLGDHEGSLSLDSVTDLSSPMLEALTKKPTKLSLRSLKSLPFGGLNNLQQRGNVTVRLFSLKRLSEAKASRLARLPVKFVLDSGSSLSSNTVEILAGGTAQFTIQDSGSIDPSVFRKIKELKATNIRIDTSTELQIKIGKLLDGISFKNTIQLTNQNTFSVHDLESIQKTKKHLRVVFEKPVLFDESNAKLISQSKADFVFLQTGKLSDKVITSLLAHAGTVTLGAFSTNDEQCQKITVEKMCGQLEIPSYLNFEITKDQMEELTKNKRIDVS